MSTIKLIMKYTFVVNLIEDININTIHNKLAQS
jgi:hypothetical protein